MSPPPILLRLRVETAMHHAASDEHRLRGLSVSTVPSYRALLARIFGFELAVERALLRLIERDHTWIEHRMRMPMLREDLRVLGSTESELARVPVATLHIPSLAHGLGWLFVLERQALLDGQILRHVEHALGTQVHCATRYLGVRGGRPGTAFRAFSDALGELPQNLLSSTMVHGAVEGFRAQHQWYDGELVSPHDSRAYDQHMYAPAR